MNGSLTNWKISPSPSEKNLPLHLVINFSCPEHPAFQSSGFQALALEHLIQACKKSLDKFVVSFMDYPITICTFCLCSPATQRQNWGQSPLTLMTNPTSIQKHVRNYVQHIIGCEMSHKLGAFHTDPQFPKDATQPFWIRRLV